MSAAIAIELSSVEVLLQVDPVELYRLQHLQSGSPLLWLKSLWLMCKP